MFKYFKLKKEIRGYRENLLEEIAKDDFKTVKKMMDDFVIRYAFERKVDTVDALGFERKSNAKDYGFLPEIYGRKLLKRFKAVRTASDMRFELNRILLEGFYFPEVGMTFPVTQQQKSSIKTMLAILG